MNDAEVIIQMENYIKPDDSIQATYYRTQRQHRWMERYKQ